MRILHAISQRPDSTGSGIYLQALLKQAAAHGQQNYLLAGQQPLPNTTLPGVPSAQITYVGFTNDIKDRQCIIGMSDIMPYRSRKFRDLDHTALNHYRKMLTKAVEKAIEIAQPDLIHSHHLWLLTAYLKDRYPQIPLVVNCHGSDLRQIQQCPWIYQLIKEQCQQVDRVFSLGQFQKTQILHYYQIPEKNIIAVGAGFDEAIFHPPSYTADHDHQQVHLIYGGKISRAKGLPWLIEAFKSFPPDRFHLHLVGGGNGQEYDQIINQANQLKNITYHGILSQKDFAQQLRNADIFILASLHEGLPLVILEALACGCKVIATALPGVREIIDRTDRSTISTLPLPDIIDTDKSLLKDEQSFIAQLRVAIKASADSLPVTAATQQLIAETFSWPAVFAKIADEWQALVER